MTFEQNVRAVLECNFTETKEEIVNIACNKICELCKNLLEELMSKIEKQEMNGKGELKAFYNSAIDDAVAIIFDYKEEQLYSATPETKSTRFVQKEIIYSMSKNDEQAQETIKFLKDKYEWGGAEVPCVFDEKEGVYRVSLNTWITHEELYEENGGKGESK